MAWDAEKKNVTWRNRHWNKYKNANYYVMQTERKNTSCVNGLLEVE